MSGEASEGFSWTERAVRRIPGGGTEPDAVVVEEPLEIRLDGEVLAVTMRTPGRPDDDRRLALGFLLAEGLIRGLADVERVERPSSGIAQKAPGEPQEPFCNAIAVQRRPGVPGAFPGTGEALGAIPAARRGTLTTSACGVCGRATIEDLLARLPRLPPSPALSAAVILSSPERLRESQGTFARTGSIHAAAALDTMGQVLAAAEDVGRHNAVDKVVGALLESGRLADAALLVVSGRTSFEMVQKAAMAGIPALAGVGGVTSMAVDLAERCGLTLAGFVRDGRASVYAGVGGGPP